MGCDRETYLLVFDRRTAVYPFFYLDLHLLLVARPIKLPCYHSSFVVKDGSQGPLVIDSTQELATYSRDTTAQSYLSDQWIASATVLTGCLPDQKSPDRSRDGVDSGRASACQFHNELLRKEGLKSRLSRQIQ